MFLFLEEDWCICSAQLAAGRLALLYCYKHGVSAAQTLQALGSTWLASGSTLAPKWMCLNMGPPENGWRPFGFLL